jgi:hypothetical protein
VTFTGLAGALGAIQRVEFGHVARRQGEVENLRVLADPPPWGQCTSSRGTPLSRSAWPTLSSLP